MGLFGRVNMFTSFMFRNFSEWESVESKCAESKCAKPRKTANDWVFGMETIGIGVWGIV